MKYRKKYLIIPILIVFFFAGCKQKQTVYDFNKESSYAHIKNESTFIDYMDKSSEILLEKGLAKSNKKDIMFGIYPESELIFNLIEKKPFNLFLSFKQFKKGEYLANSFSININDQALDQIDISKNTSRRVKVSISPEILKTGKNVIKFIYHTNKKKPFSLESTKREFAIIFQQLILSSLTTYSALNKFINYKKQILKNNDYAFIQEAPSEIDYYLDIPSHSSLNCKFKFFPFNQDIKKPINLDLQICIQKPEGREQIIHQYAVTEAITENIIKITFSDITGIVRLSFKVKTKQPHQSPIGFLAWTEAAIVKKIKKQKKKPISDKNIANLRDSLSDKNVIIILLDCARPDHFSNYGYFRDTTPNIKNFAKNATTFTNAFSESLTTRTSIATLFTGFPLEVTYMLPVVSKLPDELTTLAQYFKAKGFKTTGYTGVGNIGSVFNFHRGFDEYFELYKEDTFTKRSQEYIPYVFPWLQANKKKKFFLYVHLKEPHAIYIPLPRFQGKFSNNYPEKIGLTEYSKNPQNLTDGQVEYIRACYDECLASADSVVGKFLKRIEELDLLEKSIILIMADHGEFLGEKGREGRIFSHGGCFGDYGIHIPLIIRLPENNKNKFPHKINALVKMSDIFTTMADIFQFKTQKELMEGKSLLPLFIDFEQEINSHVISGKFGTIGHCYRTKDSKLILWEKSNLVEFFDLQIDPEEVNEIYDKNNIKANFYLIDLKKWIAKQRFIKNVLIKQNKKREIDLKDIDKKTLENLKSLGYIN